MAVKKVKEPEEVCISFDSQKEINEIGMSETPELRRKDVKDLIELCQLSKQVIHRYYDDPAILTGLFMAFCVDLITLDTKKISDLCTDDVKSAFMQFMLVTIEEARKK